MNVEELIRIGADGVRKSAPLMAAYIGFYTEIMGSAPNCAGCTFKNDFQKLQNRVSSKNKIQFNTSNMAKNFELSRGVSDKILTYKMGQRTYRSYGRNADNVFVANFLTHGTPDELKARAEFFKTPLSKTKIKELATPVADVSAETKAAPAAASPVVEAAPAAASPVVEAAPAAAQTPAEKGAATKAAKAKAAAAEKDAADMM